MGYRKITAIIRTTSQPAVQRELDQLGVHMTITQVKGHGEPDLANPGDPHIQIEVFADADRVEEIVHTIMETARTGRPGDGIIAVLPVERMYRIRTKNGSSFSNRA
jgi:nitrogen regulatory protein P-II 1